MANELRIILTWTNNVSFEAKAVRTLQGQPALNFIIVKADENQHLLNIWRPLTETLEIFVKSTMADIAKDMAVP